jgi:hypothetical protein
MELLVEEYLGSWRSLGLTAATRPSETASH